MNIDLLHPDHDALLKKWASIINATENIWTWTNPLELSWLAEYATTINKLVEVGSYNGRSAKVMLLANPTLLLTSLDTWDDAGSFETYQKTLAPEIADGRVSFVRGNSQDNLAKLDPWFDGCFVDGGHLERLVKADIEGVLPLMKEGSLIAGHDYSVEQKNDVWRGVNSVLKDVKNPVDSVWAYQL
jgi:predicted O-methyltransferase YrrM